MFTCNFPTGGETTKQIFMVAFRNSSLLASKSLAVEGALSLLDDVEFLQKNGFAALEVLLVCGEFWENNFRLCLLPLRLSSDFSPLQLLLKDIISSFSELLPRLLFRLLLPFEPKLIEFVGESLSQSSSIFWHFVSFSSSQSIYLLTSFSSAIISGRNGLFGDVKEY